MGYNIAICDDDNLMARNIKNSMLHEFSNKGWQDVTIDYYEDVPGCYQALKRIIHTGWFYWISIWSLWTDFRLQSR